MREVFFRANLLYVLDITMERRVSIGLCMTLGLAKRMPLRSSDFQFKNVLGCDFFFLLPSAMPERWPQIGRIRITFGSLLNNFFDSTKTNSLKFFVKWFQVSLNTHVRSNQTQPYLNWCGPLYLYAIVCVCAMYMIYLHHSFCSVAFQ